MFIYVQAKLLLWWPPNSVSHEMELPLPHVGSVVSGLCRGGWLPVVLSPCLLWLPAFQSQDREGALLQVFLWRELSHVARLAAAEAGRYGL